MTTILDIIICTYEREELLIDCLSSLIEQDVTTDLWNILIVNNSNRPFTDATVNHIAQVSNATTIHEKKAGLSQARNTGIANSTSPWIAFLDDDAKVPTTYVSQIRSIIEQEDFDCFGGHINSWWRYGKPRWLDQSFGSKPILRKDRGEIIDQYNWGSNIVINRNALNVVGNFPNYIGMKGKKLGYAAENIVQINLREKGYKIGYDPNLYINHVVMPQKLQMMWHLKSAYSTGRDGKAVFKHQYGLRGFLKSLKNCISRPAKSKWKYATRSDFYWENLILESLKPYFLIAGKLRSLLK